MVSGIDKITFCHRRILFSLLAKELFTSLKFGTLSFPSLVKIASNISVCENFMKLLILVCCTADHVAQIVLKSLYSCLTEMEIYLTRQITGAFQTVSMSKPINYCSCSIFLPSRYGIISKTIIASRWNMLQKMTGPGSSVGRVSTPGNGRSQVLILGRDIPKSLKMILAAPRLALLRGRARTGQPSVRIM